MCEPWCWHPDQVARLTDWQILDIRRRQSEKVEAIQKESEKNRPPETGSVNAASAFSAPIPDDGPPPKGAYLDFATNVLGIPRDIAEGQYERQLKRWREKNGEATG